MRTRWAPNVLIVEDDDDTREMYATCLKLSGFRVTEARDGRQALSSALAHVPDVIVTDLALPGFDGLALCHSLKRSSTTRDVPIIMVSGQITPDEVQHARQLGCNAVYEKPLDPYTLRDAVISANESHDHAHVALRRSR